jgi:hypothetical protein
MGPGMRVSLAGLERPAEGIAATSVFFEVKRWIG